MKTFYQYIKEDFNSTGAIQFSMNAKRVNGSYEIIVFYEHTTNFNLFRFSESFLPNEVAELMKSRYNDWRVMVLSNKSSFDIFVWPSTILHSDFSQMLDSNKSLKKYPQNINYHEAYSKTYLLGKKDTVSDTWCFPFTIVRDQVVVNLSPKSLIILQETKNCKSLFKIPDAKWESLLDIQSCKI